MRPWDRRVKKRRRLLLEPSEATEVISVHLGPPESPVLAGLEESASVESDQNETPESLPFVVPSAPGSGDEKVELPSVAEEDTVRNEMQPKDDFVRSLQSHEFSQFVNNSFIKHAKLTSIALPWEQGVHKYLFDENHSQFEIPRLPAENALLSSMPTVQEARQASGSSLDRLNVTPGRAMFESHISCIRDETYQEQRDSLMNAGVDKWLWILNLHACLSHTMSLLEQYEGSALFEAEAKKTIAAILGVRSPHTVIKRANALIEFFQWAAKTLRGAQGSLTEANFWRFVNCLKDNNAAATKASNVLSAVRFARYVFGFDIIDILDSRRIVGLTDQLFAKKRPLKQAVVLTVTQILLLHRILDDVSRNAYDRAICGYLLIALYGRCRHSDLANVHDISHDHDSMGGFLELKTRHHKTSRSAAKKATLMPILVPALGVHGKAWLGQFFELLKAFGLPSDGLLEGPLIRPPRSAACEEFFGED